MILPSILATSQYMSISIEVFIRDCVVMKWVRMNCWKVQISLILLSWKDTRTSFIS
jgi:hypothetical protein